jgi:predicted ATPase
MLFDVVRPRGNGMEGKKFLRSIRLENMLSFGREMDDLALEPLNVLIGPHGAGKSNLIAAIGLLAAAPRDLAGAIRDGGGVREWMAQGQWSQGPARLTATVEGPRREELSYVLAFTEADSRLKIVREALLDASRETGEEAEEWAFFSREGLRLSIRSVPDTWPRFVSEAAPMLDPRWGDVGPDESVLARIRDSHLYPQLTFVSDSCQKIRLFRDWSFRAKSAIRQPQRADLPEDFLSEDANNLGLVLNQLGRLPATRSLLLEKLKILSDDIEDLETPVQGGMVQILLQEKGGRSIPASRLSDGTLRYLCLLAILCHPLPPPLICLEAPELGLHPDILPAVAELLVDASTRTQLIVTTHSETLISALSGNPEALVVCEKSPAGTRLRRLESSGLGNWLDEYKLGEVWRMGEIGGNRESVPAWSAPGLCTIPFD